MTTKRRIEITVFRRQRLAITDTRSEPQPSTTAADESLVEEIAALVKQLTGDSLISIKQEVISADDDSESESR